ncbi:hypothetical protein NMY22_g2244 [Coprinellus aureogranulatus]|nr:hypothetical protein NMY22_g2244 [Coprinellus aureogranulatus]
MSAPKLQLARPTTLERIGEVASAENELVTVSDVSKSCKEGASLKELREIFSDLSLPMGSNGVLLEFKDRVHSTPSGTVSKRTASKPFMALELLGHPRETIKHTRQHDIESVIWTLVWLYRKDLEWCYESYRDVYCAKTSYGWAKPWELPEGIAKEYEVIWPMVAKLLSDGQILDAIQQDASFPFPSEYKDWNWAHLHQLGLNKRMNAFDLQPTHSAISKREGADNEHTDTLVREVLRSCEKGTNLKDVREILGELLNKRGNEPHQKSPSPSTGSQTVVPGFMDEIMANKGDPCTLPKDFDLSRLSLGTLNSSKRTPPKPFTALELLGYPHEPIKRSRRHDLESVIWALVWLCRKDPKWLYEPPENVYSFKASYIWAAPWKIPKDIAKEYEVLWPLVSKLVITWVSTHLDAEVTEMLGTLSDGQVLDIIKQDGSFMYPSEDKNWDWAHFPVE